MYEFMIILEKFALNPGPRSAFLGLLVSMLFVGGCDSAAGRSHLLSKKSFDSIQLGLSYEQVVDVAGFPGLPMPDQGQDEQAAASFSWPTSNNGDKAVVVFQSDKAIEKIAPRNW